MIKTMCNFRLQPLFLLFCFVTLSCSEKEDILQTLSNEVVYSSYSYKVSYALVSNSGPDETHYNYDFTITDGSIEHNDIMNGTFGLYVALFSADTTEFKTGTFQFLSEEDNIKENVIDKSFFTDNSYFFVDVNRDGNIEEVPSEEIRVTGGTITVSGEMPDFTIVYDLMLEDGETLKGNYSGTFDTEENG